MYHDKNSCAEMLFCISNVLHKSILDRIRDSNFFGVMIDEFTDVSVTGRVVVFASFVEEGLPITAFLGLLEISGGKKDAQIIFYCLLKSIEKWGLDIQKCVGFGFDGAATMLAQRVGVATRFKKIIPFVTSVHCIVHITNLVTLKVAKSMECKSLSVEIDVLFNSVAAYFKNSRKKKYALNGIQKELNEAQRTMKRYYKIKWLSRFQAISTLCDSLEFCDCVFL